MEYAAMECTAKTLNEMQGRLITRKISNNIHVITNLREGYNNKKGPKAFTTRDMSRPLR